MRHTFRLSLLVAVFVLACASAAFAQNGPPPAPGVITIVTPSAGATLVSQGVSLVAVTVSGPVNAAALTATLTKDGVFGTVATAKGFLLSGTVGQYVSEPVSLPESATAAGFTWTVTDGAVTTTRAFTIGPKSQPDPTPNPPTVPTTDTQVLAMLSTLVHAVDANQLAVISTIQNTFGTIRPLPTPQGSVCDVASPTVVRKSDGRWTLTLTCDPTIAPAPPPKNGKVTVLPQLSSGAVIK